MNKSDDSIENSIESSEIPSDSMAPTFVVARFQAIELRLEGHYHGVGANPHSIDASDASDAME